MPFGTDSALRHKLPTTNEHIIGNHRWRRPLEVLDKLAEDVAIAYVR